MHFFNPPVMMRLVELVRGLATADAALERARAFATDLGKEVVVCRRDSPASSPRAPTRRCARSACGCSRRTSRARRTSTRRCELAFNFPMGPLELSDFNGIDVYADAVSALADAHGDRFRPPVGVRNMVAAGRLGRKSGRGFYSYDADGARIEGSGAYG